MSSERVTTGPSAPPLLMSIRDSLAARPDGRACRLSLDLLLAADVSPMAAPNARSKRPATQCCQAIRTALLELLAAAVPVTSTVCLPRLGEALDMVDDSSEQFESLLRSRCPHWLEVPRPELDVRVSVSVAVVEVQEGS